MVLRLNLHQSLNFPLLHFEQRLLGKKFVHKLPIQHVYIFNNDCGGMDNSEAFEYLGSRILPLPKSCYISVNFTSAVHFPSKSVLLFRDQWVPWNSLNPC